MPTAKRCSLASSVVYMSLPFQGDPEVVDPSPMSPSVPDVYDVDQDAEGEWDFVRYTDVWRSRCSLELADGFYRYSQQVHRLLG